ncbi:MAG: hypothetical protein ACTSRP_00065 [Candidatus Helarchaeota archaeon]
MKIRKSFFYLKGSGNSHYEKLCDIIISRIIYEKLVLNALSLDFLKDARFNTSTLFKRKATGILYILIFIFYDVMA